MQHLRTLEQQGQKLLHNFKPLLTVDEVITLTSIKRGTLYKLTSQRKIPHYKVGKKLIFKTLEVLGFIDRYKVDTL